MIRRTESLRQGRTIRRPVRPEAPAPTAHRERKKRKVRLPKFLARRDWDALLTSCSCQRDRALVAVLLYAALRASEACGLEWRDVDFEGEQLHVRHGKGDKEAYVYLAPAAAAELKALGPGLEYDPVFRSREGGAICRRTAGRIVKRAATAAGLKLKLTADGETTSAVSPHWLRHSCATQMLAKGADIRKVQKHLRHARLDTTEIYTHIQDDQLKAAVREI